MSTLAQMKSVAAPLLARHPELAMIRRTLFLRPVNHVLRFIALDNTSGLDGFRPEWGAMPLFEYVNTYHLTYTYPLRYQGKNVSWDVNDPDVERHLMDKVEDEALPGLNAMRTIADFAEFASDNTFPRTDIKLFPTSQITIDIALGQLEAARAICAGLASRRARVGPSNFEADSNRIFTELCPPLQREDRPALAAVLHRWEAYTVKALKLEKYWEPTSFPIEEL